MIQDFVNLVSTAYRWHEQAVRGARTKGFIITEPKGPTGDYQLRETDGGTILAILHYLPAGMIDHYPYRWVQVFGPGNP